MLQSMFVLKEDFEPIPTLHEMQYLKAVNEASTLDKIVSAIARRVEECKDEFVGFLEPPR